MFDKLSSLLSRLFFSVGLILLIIAIIDWCMRLFGYTFSWLEYQPGRLFEFSAILMITVAVLILRQIRNQLKK
ncbi:MAG: hypothetical protein DWP97_09615 [Calditrichaeota bacterium]|nr:MAG: hypothetical protein DWP97_09615 [Calditrichota bacterium]